MISFRMEPTRVLTLIICIQSVSFGLKFQPTNYGAGLTFIKLNKVEITRTTWQMLYFYDLSDYFIQIEKIQIIIDQIDALCRESTQKESCNVLLELLKNHMENSQMNAERVESFSTNRRKRWAPLGYVGDIYAYVLGFMTKEDAEEMINNIENLQEIANYQRKLLQNQTLIIQQTVQINNRTYNDLKQNVDSLSLKINEVERNRTIDYHITTLTQIATLIIQNHNQVSSTLTNILQNSVNGKIINLIPKNQLEKDLRMITENLHSNQKLPINLKTQHVFNIFAVTSSKATLYKRRIMLLLNIPIVESDDMFLYKAIPIPTAIRQEMIIIVPTTEYFLVNPHRSEITPINEKELTNCKKIERNKLICNPESPTIINKEYSCELTILLNPNTEIAEKLCQFQTVINKNYVIQLDQNNKYYCAIQTPLLFTETCPNGTINTITIPENGIIKIEQGCALLTNELKIIPSHIKTSDATILKPQFDLKGLDIDKLLQNSANISNILNKNYSMVIVGDFNSDILKLSKDITENLRKTQEKYEFEEMVKNTNKINYFHWTILAVVVIGILICYKKFCKN